LKDEEQTSIHRELQFLLHVRYCGDKDIYKYSEKSLIDEFKELVDIKNRGRIVFNEKVLTGLIEGGILQSFGK
jgi:hypothetical protein